ncbi:hypothetical protein MHYP_G00288650 [Metynnis hypsauchen]
MATEGAVYLRWAGVISSITAGKSITLNFEKGISGRYVNVVIPGDNNDLTLCEVEVYGYPTPDGKSITLNFEKGISGFHVNVVIPGDNKILTLCEVEVYGYPTQDGENVDLKGRATQSSLHSFNFASNAFDGNRDSNAIHERLSGAEIRIGDSLDNNGNNNNTRCAVISSIDKSNPTMSFEYNGMGDGPSTL